MLPRMVDDVSGAARQAVSLGVVGKLIGGSSFGACWCAIAVDEAVVGLLAVMFETIFPHLDERQRRLLAGAQARSLGHGGIRAVAQAAGMREGTVSDGVAELESGAEPLGRVRRASGGRKSAAEADPGLVPALLALVEPDMRGDPMSPLRWTTKSTRNLARVLSKAGHRVSADTVGDLLRAEGFSLHGSAKGGCQVLCVSGHQRGVTGMG